MNQFKELRRVIHLNILKGHVNYFPRFKNYVCEVLFSECSFQIFSQVSWRELYNMLQLHPRNIHRLFIDDWKHYKCV